MQISRVILSLFVLVLFSVAPSPASAQTVTVGETKVSIVFYVKEGTKSPYQGLLQMTVPEFQAMKNADLRAAAQAQYAAWKAQPKPSAPTADDLADEVVATKSQADDLAARIAALMADPAVAAKIAARNK